MTGGVTSGGLLPRSGTASTTTAPATAFGRRGTGGRRRDRVTGLQLGPPVRQFLLRFARLGAQHQEIVGGAEARMGEQALRTLTGALGETRLHLEDLDHGRGETPRQRHALDLL